MLLAITICCAGTIAKPVHHYIFYGRDREKIQNDTSFFETKAFEGAQVTYS